jgi:hypothetical protein
MSPEIPAICESIITIFSMFMKNLSYISYLYNLMIVVYYQFR